MIGPPGAGKTMLGDRGQVLQCNIQFDFSFRAACVARSKARLTVP